MNAKTMRRAAIARKKVVAKRTTKEKQSKPKPVASIGSDLEMEQFSRPVEIRVGPFKKRIRKAHEIPVVVANWLIEQGKAVQNFENFVHASNVGFKPTATTKRLSSGQFMEVGSDQKDLLRKARILLDSCGYKGRPIEVLLKDGSVLTA
jgi:hypothetical protein